MAACKAQCEEEEECEYDRLQTLTYMLLTKQSPVIDERSVYIKETTEDLTQVA